MCCDVHVTEYLFSDALLSAYCETRTGLGLGPGLGPVQNPDSRKTRTRHSDLPSEKAGLVSTKPGTRLIKKTEFKTGLIKKRSFTPVFKITRPKKI